MQNILIISFKYTDLEKEEAEFPRYNIMLNDYITTKETPMEEIQVKETHPHISDAQLYFHCVKGKDGTGWACVGVYVGRLYIQESGWLPGNSPHMELLVALTALRALPKGTNSVNIFTTTDYLRKVTDGGIKIPKKYEKNVQEYKDLTKNLDIQLYIRTGNWGDPWFEECCQKAKMRSQHSASPKEEANDAEEVQPA